MVTMDLTPLGPSKKGTHASQGYHLKNGRRRAVKYSASQGYPAEEWEVGS